MNPDEPPNSRLPVAQCAIATDAPPLKYPHEFAPPPVSFVNAATFSLLCKQSDTQAYRLDISAPEVSAQSTSKGTDKLPIPKVYRDFADIFSHTLADSTPSLRLHLFVWLVLGLRPGSTKTWVATKPQVSTIKNMSRRYLRQTLSEEH